MKPHALVAALAGVALAGCAAAGGWSRPGADAASVKGAYAACRAAAESAVAPEIGIDQDIQATRQTDWQRAHIGRVAADMQREDTRGRADAIIESCMKSQGFSRSRQ